MLYTTDNEKLLPPVQSEDLLPSVSPWTILTGMFLVGTIGSAIFLAAFIKYNVTVKAPATVRPLGEVHLVQPKMEGSVKNIFVKENQVVKSGDVIARLDDEQLQIKKAQLQSNIKQTELQLVQIDAQIRTLTTQILAESRFAEGNVASAQADLIRIRREYQERQATTKTELLAANASLRKAQADWQKMKSDLNFANREMERYKKLAVTGAIPINQFEQKQLAFEQAKSAVAAEARTIEIAKAKYQSALASLNPSSATIIVAQERIAQEVAKGESTIATLQKEKQALIQQRVEIVNQIGQYQKELKQVENQIQKSVIVATSNGVILKLNLRNPGQFVQPSESIAQIVPQNTPLLIKAMVSTQDIQKVAVGQKVQLRVDACPYPDYGTLKGFVSEVSPDAMTSQNNNATNSYFEATIKPNGLTLGDKKKCQIQSGMDARAEIISKEESVLQFVLRKARIITDI